MGRAILDLLLTLPIIALALVGSSALSQKLGSAMGVLDAAVRLVVVVGLYLAVLVAWRKRRPREDLGWYPDGGEIARGALLGAGASILSFAGSFAAGGFELRASEPSPVTALALLAAIAMAVTFEEVAFRSGWMGALHQVLPKWLVITVPASAFALLHLGNPHASALGMASSILVSIFIGWSFLGTGESAPRLGVPLGFHFAWNLLQPLFGVPVSGQDRSPWLEAVPQDSLWSGGRYGLEGSIVTTAVAVALLLLAPKLIPWARGRRRPRAEPAPR
jgi:hypothetical protein